MGSKLIPGVASTLNFEFVDDAAFTLTTSSLGVIGGIRDDTLSALAAAEGDAVPFRVSSTGALHVTGGGGGVEPTDDTTTHATGTSVGTSIMGVATPTDAAVDANDFGHIAMSLDRRMHVDADITASVALDVSAATVVVDLGANNDVTITGDALTALQLIDDAIAGTEMQVDVVAALPTGTNTIGQVGITDVSFAVADGNALGEGVLVQGDDGTDRKNIAVDATTGDVQVDVTNTVTVAAHAVTNAGTFATQIDGDALTALQLIDNAISGAGFNITQLGGVNVTLNTGTVGTGTLRVTIATDDTVTVDNAGTFATQVDGDASRRLRASL